MKIADIDSIKSLINAIKAKFQLKEDGKGLSSNDYTDKDKNKVAYLPDTTNSVNRSYFLTSKNNEVVWNDCGWLATEEWVGKMTSMGELSLEDNVLSYHYYGGNSKTSITLPYVTQEWVDGKGYATQTWVSNQGYATQTWVNNRGYLTSEDTYIKDEIDAYDASNLELEGNELKLSHSDGTSISVTLPDSGVSEEWVGKQGFATQTWVNNKGYITSSYTYPKSIIDSYDANRFSINDKTLYLYHTGGGSISVELPFVTQSWLSNNYFPKSGGEINGRTDIKANSSNISLYPTNGCNYLFSMTTGGASTNLTICGKDSSSNIPNIDIKGDVVYFPKTIRIGDALLTYNPNTKTLVCNTKFSAS